MPNLNVAQSSLEQCLHDFRARFNENVRVKKLIKGWNRTILIDPTDADTQFTIVVDDLSIVGIQPGAAAEDDELVHVQASEETLKRIFTGAYNPAHALIDGALAVFSSERDKVKLEAITMVIWG